MLLFRLLDWLDRPQPSLQVPLPDDEVDRARLINFLFGRLNALNDVASAAVQSSLPKRPTHTGFSGALRLPLRWLIA